MSIKQDSVTVPDCLENIFIRTMRNSTMVSLSRKQFLEVFRFIEAQQEALRKTEQTLAEREKFKAYVHKRLDEMGIDPHHEQNAEPHGCRIGARLDDVREHLKYSLK